LKRSAQGLRAFAIASQIFTRPYSGAALVHFAS
jgi:hypothetical protein